MALWIQATRLEGLVIAGAIFGLGLMVASLIGAAVTGLDLWTYLAYGSMLGTMGGLYAYFSWETGKGGKRALLKQARSHDPAARAKAVGQLYPWRMEGEFRGEARAAVLAALVDSDLRVQQEAVYRAPDLADGRDDYAEVVAERLAAMAGAPPKELAGAALLSLEDLSEKIRGAVGTKAMRHLLAMMDGPQVPSRLGIVQSLGKVAVAVADPTRAEVEARLLRALEENDADLRRDAFLSLCELAIHDPLRPQSKAWKEEYLARTRVYLTRAPPTDHDERSWGVRAIYAFPQAYGEGGLREVVTALQDFARHRSDEEKRAAIDGLTTLFPHLTDRERAQALDLALEATADATPGIRGVLAACLPKLARDAPETKQVATVQALVAISKHSDEFLRMMAADAMGEMCPHIHDSTWQIAEPRLREMKKDESKIVRWAARCALDPAQDEESEAIAGHADVTTVD